VHRAERNRLAPILPALYSQARRLVSGSPVVPHELIRYGDEVLLLTAPV
jgi:hypothetical protein